MNLSQFKCINDKRIIIIIILSLEGELKLNFKKLFCFYLRLPPFSLSLVFLSVPSVPRSPSLTLSQKSSKIFVTAFVSYLIKVNLKKIKKFQLFRGDKVPRLFDNNNI